MQKINLFIRSLLFSTILVIVTIPYSIFCLLIWALPLRLRYSVIMAWTLLMIWLLKKLCYINYTVEGFENIPQDRSGVILSKHQSAWETFFLPNLFHHVAIILKKELLWIPFFGWGLATISPIAINRNDRSSSMEQIIKKGTTCLQTGRWILVFPEGTRIAPGQIGKYRLGGARLAVHAESPVIPVAHNAGRFWSKRKFIKRPGTVQVVIGPVIETKGRTPEEVTTLAKEWIEETMLRIDTKLKVIPHL